MPGIVPYWIWEKFRLWRTLQVKENLPRASNRHLGEMSDFNTDVVPTQCQGPCSVLVWSWSSFINAT